MSGGELALTNNVIDYYRADNTKAYYYTNMGNKAKVVELVNEAPAALDATNDFSTLTMDNNEVISLNVLYAIFQVTHQ